MHLFLLFSWGVWDYEIDYLTLFMAIHTYFKDRICFIKSSGPPPTIFWKTRNEWKYIIEEYRTLKMTFVVVLVNTRNQLTSNILFWASLLFFLFLCCINEFKWYLIKLNGFINSLTYSFHKHSLYSRKGFSVEQTNSFIQVYPISELNGYKYTGHFTYILLLT